MISVWSIGLFAIGIALVLMVLFPSQRLFDRIARDSAPSPVTIFFLQNLLKATPGDYDLRLLLAQHQTTLGLLDEALRTMTPLLNHEYPEARRQAYVLYLNIRETQAYQSPDGSQARERALSAIGESLAQLFDEPALLTPEGIAHFTKVAERIGRQDLAYRIYGELAGSTGSEARTWAVKAAKLALADQRYTEAAKWYFQAQRRATTRSQRRHYYVSALKALQAGSLFTQALREAPRHLGDLANDEATLLYLVSLGRAAGDGTFSQTYVMRVLQLSSLEDEDVVGAMRLVAHVPGHRSGSEWQLWTREADRAFFGGRWSGMSAGRPQGDAWTVRPVAKRRRTFRAFDDHIYQLAYDVFLENSNVEQAYELATQAVAQAPNRLKWRRQLATVAEWNSRQDVALEQWIAVAKRAPDVEAFTEVARLATMLLDDEQLVFALLGLGKIRGLQGNEWKQLSDAYERLGSPVDAIVYLSTHRDEYPTADVLKHIAGLYERMGHGAEALDYYRQLEDQHGWTVDSVTHYAQLLTERGELTKAYHLLQSVKAQADDSAVAYWEFLGHLAWLLEDNVQAEESYRVLFRQRDLSPDARERLVTLMRWTDQPEAVDVAFEGWTQDRSPRLLLEALDLLVAQGEHQRIHAILDGLSESDAELLRYEPAYWAIRADAMWRAKRFSSAHEAYKEALRLDPAAPDTLEAYLWFLINRQLVSDLRPFLEQHRASLQDQARLWGAVAAAYVVLRQPHDALAWYHKQLNTHADDYLWLLNYAQTLEQTGNRALAWTIRHQAWSVIRRSQTPVSAMTMTPDQLDAYLTLAFEKDPGDPFRELLARTAANHTSPVLKELVVSWFLSREEYDAARMWLWRQYATEFSQPAWSRLAVALQHNDWDGIDRVVAQRTADLSAADKAEAAMRLQRYHLAQTLSADALAIHPESNTIQPQYEAAALATANQVNTLVTFEERSPLSSYMVKADASLQFGRLTITPALDVRWQDTMDAASLPGVPATDRQFGLAAAYRWPNRTLRLAAFHRRALDRFFGFSLAYQEQWSGRATSVVTLGRNLRADDSVLLSVAGVKDMVRANGVYRFSHRQFVELQLEHDWFLTQARERLGRGMGVEGTIGHRFRSEFPEVVVRLVGQIQRYTRREGLPESVSGVVPPSVTALGQLAVPENFEQAGLILSLNESLRDTYTRGIRPFGALGININRVTGLGHNIEGGIVARLLGRDRLLIYGSYNRGGFGRDATTTRLNMEYQQWF